MAAPRLSPEHLRELHEDFESAVGRHIYPMLSKGICNTPWGQQYEPIPVYRYRVERGRYVRVGRIQITDYAANAPLSVLLQELAVQISDDCRPELIAHHERNNVRPLGEEILRNLSDTAKSHFCDHFDWDPNDFDMRDEAWALAQQFLDANQHQLKIHELYEAGRKSWEPEPRDLSPTRFEREDVI
jgi:hypothetical protein